LGFKLCVLVFNTRINSLRNLAPSYLSCLVAESLRSLAVATDAAAARGDLVVPITRTVHCGFRSFAVTGPSMELSVGTATQLESNCSSSFRSFVHELTT